MTWIEAVVAARSAAADDIAVLDLAPAGGGELPGWAAGAHIDVQPAPGLVRQYSLCGPPEPGRYRIAVLRTPDSRGGSRAVHAIDIGAPVRISAPRNHFPLAAARRHLLFAGGIGITPLLAMRRELRRAGHDYALHYSARSRSRAAFLGELAADPRVTLHLDDGDPAQLLDAAAALGDPDPETAVYVCGPDGYAGYLLGKAAALGWPAHALHTERFGTAAGTGSAGAEFIVRLASTGARYPIPAGTSVLDVLLDSGVEAPYSCRQGICGECVVRVLAGEPDHRDDVLTDAERAAGDFTTCSSRAHSPELHLDL